MGSFMTAMQKYRYVTGQCEEVVHNDEQAGIYRCDEDIVEWYPELDVGYYVVDREFAEVKMHTESFEAALGFAEAFDQHRSKYDAVPLV